jgi:hypothetical protein
LEWIGDDWKLQFTNVCHPFEGELMKRSQFWVSFKASVNKFVIRLGRRWLPSKLRTIFQFLSRWKPRVESLSKHCYPRFCGSIKTNELWIDTWISDCFTHSCSVFILTEFSKISLIWFPSKSLEIRNKKRDLIDYLQVGQSAISVNSININ